MSDTIKHTPYQNVDAFLDGCEAQLLKHAIENNVILGLSYRLQKDPDLGKGFRFGAFGESIYMLTGQNLCLACGFDPDCVAPLVEQAKGWNIPGVVGDKDAVTAFSAAWHQDVRKTIGLIVHKLTEVSPPENVSGYARLAGAEDAVLITDWIEGFKRDSGVPDVGKPDRKQHMIKAQKMIADRAVHLWCDDMGQPVSMAVRSREIGDIANISYVYTPENFRGNGYASAVVAALSTTLLESGRSACCLFTDADNPTSNKIYAKIGFYPIAHSCHDIYLE